MFVIIILIVLSLNKSIKLIFLTVVVKQQINDKFKHRLQQLDEFEELVSEHKGLSRDDYVFRITQISQELCHAWALDQRVKALKIVIQVRFIPFSNLFLKLRS